VEVGGGALCRISNALASNVTCGRGQRLCRCSNAAFATADEATMAALLACLTLGLSLAVAVMANYGKQRHGMYGSPEAACQNAWCVTAYP
jgi:hydroxylamine reductase (hybrid-cluster protein)